VKTKAFLANEKQGNFSKGNLLGSNPFIAANKTKLTKKTKTTDAPRKTHSA
jgi:hypothetical protein